MCQGGLTCYMGDGYPSLLVGTQNPYGPWAYDRSIREFGPQHFMLFQICFHEAGPHNPEGTLLSSEALIQKTGKR